MVGLSNFGDLTKEFPDKNRYLIENKIVKFILFGQGLHSITYNFSKSPYFAQYRPLKTGYLLILCSDCTPPSAGIQKRTCTIADFPTVV